MSKHVLALLAALLLLLGVGAGTAAAQAPTQVAGQEAGSEQSATSSANAAQVAPSNRNVDVRIFSPGNGGAVTQTNAAGAAAIAGNDNTTDQSAAQSGSGTQAASQHAGNDQTADAEANAVQVKPSNDNIVVRIDSPGSDGPVEQTNAAGALSKAGNGNETTQSAEQDQGSGSHCCKDGGGTQAANQTAHNEQSADADADAVQIKPSNSNVSVRIDSPGNGGSVTQTNAALAGALAKNRNETTQSAEQSQDGSCKCGDDGVQAVDQKAKSEQSAEADADAKQFHPSNKNTVVRIDSPGHDGPVEQTNLALAGALAGNANATDQSATQSQGGGGVQAAGQSAHNDQDADADADAVQVKPSNDNTVVRIGSPGSSGSVTQTNAALAGALAGNLNETGQSVEQDQAGDSCKCQGGGVQGVGQKADSKQDADAESNAIQLEPSNSNTAVDLGGHDKKCGCADDHKGGVGGGDVTQTNLAGSLAIALNDNDTDQSVEQSGGGVQAVGQKADSEQDADADSNAIQLGASNDNTAAGGSGGGDVTQTNAALSGALAGNANETDQYVEQSQDGGSCKCADGVQAVGQFAFNDQDADAESNAVQLKPSNDNASVGGSGGGDVTQTNAALSGALAGNVNETDQSVGQFGGGVQVAEQVAKSEQDADAESNAIQLKPSNSNTAVDLGGHDKKKCGCADDRKGGGGDVTQTNLAASLGIAFNKNRTGQSLEQDQDGSCKCGGGVQAASQKAWNKQDADASANAFQFGASNDNAGRRGGGSVWQANLAFALGLAANKNRTDQEVSQSQT